MLLFVIHYLWNFQAVIHVGQLISNGCYSYVSVLLLIFPAVAESCELK